MKKQALLPKRSASAAQVLQVQKLYCTTAHAVKETTTEQYLVHIDRDQFLTQRYRSHLIVFRSVTQAEYSI